MFEGLYASQTMQTKYDVWVWMIWSVGFLYQFNDVTKKFEEKIRIVSPEIHFFKKSILLKYY